MADASPSNDTSKKKKRGNQGDFHGKRLEFLEAKLPDYRRASQENKVRIWFNEEFFPSYWAAFHWSLPLDKDPTPDHVYPEDGEGIEVKAATMKTITAKIKSWFNYRRNALRLNSSKDPWAKWLSQLGRPLDGPPHRPHDHQYYMHHPMHKAKVMKAYNEEWPAAGLNDGYQMSFRCAVAQRLLAKETDDFRMQLKAEAEAAHSANLERYKKGISIADSEDPQDREDAIQTFTAVVQPLLDGLRAHTGMYIQMTAVTPSADSSAAKCIFLSSGRSSNGLDFSSQDPGGFKTFTKLFMRWAMVAEGLLPTSTLINTKAMEAVNSLNAFGSTSGAAKTGVSTLNGASVSGTTKGATSGDIPDTGTVGSKAKDTVSSRPAKHIATPPSAAHKAQSRAVDNVSPDERARLQLEKAVEAARAAVVAAGFEVKEALLTSLAKLAPPEKTRRIAELSKMSRYELEREENIAENMVLLRQLGVDPALAELSAKSKGRHQDREQSQAGGDEDAYRPTAGASAAKKGKGKQANEVRRSSRHAAVKAGGPNNGCETVTNVDNGGNEKEHSGGDGGTQGQDGEDEDGASEEVIDGKDAEEQAADGGVDGEGQNGVDAMGEENEGDGGQVDKETMAGDGAPLWFSNAWTAFNRVKRTDYGDAWFDLLKNWRDWEEMNEYNDGGEDMSKQHRPPQIGVWIKSRRYFHRTPAMTSPKTFAAQWWCWWRAANPAWRVVADSDDLVTEMDGDASWGGVNATGINGLLSVIVSLWWLRAKTPDSNPTIHSWHKAVQDVTWVLQQSIGQREEQDNEEEEPPRKRVRIE